MVIPLLDGNGILGLSRAQKVSSDDGHLLGGCLPVCVWWASRDTAGGRHERSRRASNQRASPLPRRPRHTRTVHRALCTSRPVSSITLLLFLLFCVHYITSTKFATIGDQHWWADHPPMLLCYCIAAVVLLLWLNKLCLSLLRCRSWILLLQKFVPFER